MSWLRWKDKTQEVLRGKDTSSLLPLSQSVKKNERAALSGDFGRQVTSLKRTGSLHKRKSEITFERERENKQ